MFIEEKGIPTKKKCTGCYIETALEVFKRWDNISTNMLQHRRGKVKDSKYRGLQMIN